MVAPTLTDPTPPRVFFDANVLIAGSASQTGASYALSVLVEIGLLRAVVCPYVVDEAERNIVAKLPEALPRFNQIQLALQWEVTPDPTLAEVATWASIIRPKDAPVIAAAIKTNPLYLVTLDVKDFLRSPEVTTRTALKIVTPAELIREIRAVIARHLPPQN